MILSGFVLKQRTGDIYISIGVVQLCIMIAKAVARRGIKVGLEVKHTVI